MKTPDRPPETPATQFLQKNRVAHSNHLYAYEEHGGTKVSSRELNVAEHAVIKTLVMEDEKIVGIFTERDYARKIALHGRNSAQTPVRDVMTRNVLCVRPSQSSEQCMALMTENRLRHLPVVDGARLVGLISIGDLVKDIISEQQFIIAQLEHYITGGVR